MRHPPYHLRVHKAVDRQLLVELIRKLGAENYTYYTLAGPFLEDMRIMDQFFPRMKLVSLESSEHTHRRQLFHQFSSRLDLRRKALQDFLLHDYDPGNRDIFWLDYTDLKYAHFEDFQDVLKRVAHGSVVRITLRAEPELDLSVFRDRLPEPTIEAVREEVERAFSSEFEKVLPNPPAGALASRSEFARMVQLMVRRAASTALDTGRSERDFLHVHSAIYNDQTQMLSVTGVVVLRTELEEMRVILSDLRFADFEWAKPFQISVPALSQKERLKLEDALPGDGNVGEQLLDRLGYNIDETRKSSIKQLEDYAVYHREYPLFLRVAS